MHSRQPFEARPAASAESSRSGMQQSQQGSFASGFYESSSSEGSSDGENLPQRAHVKGEKRLAAVDNFLSQSPEAIRHQNLASEARYEDRYRTEIRMWGGSNADGVPVDGAEASTFVRGASDRDNPTYFNAMYVQDDRHTFQGIANFQRRPPNDADHSPTDFPVGSGRYDAEVPRGNTQPLPNSEILFNQTVNTVRAFRDAPPLSQQEQTHLNNTGQVYPGELAHFDINNYEGTHIVNVRDRQLIDSFIPQTGRITFTPTERGYGVMSGGDTVKAKHELAARFGKEVRSITIEKKYNEYNELRYNTYFRFETLNPQMQSRDNGRLMINQRIGPYVMTGSRAFNAQVRQFGTFRDATPQEVGTYANQLQQRAGELQGAGRDEEAQSLLRQRETMRAYYNRQQ